MKKFFSRAVAAAKTKAFMIGTALFLVCCTAFFFSCNNKKKLVKKPVIAAVTPPENVDLERDLVPVNRLTARQYDLLDTLRKMDSKKVGPFINKYWPELRTNVKGYIKNHYRGDSVTRINFFYGKLDSATGADSAGKIHTGHFHGLCAEVHYFGKKMPSFYAVGCMNGMCFPLDEHGKPLTLSYIKVFDVNFVIDHSGDCLTNHMDFDEAMSFGKKNKLKIYLTKIENNKPVYEKISYTKATKDHRNDPNVYIPVSLGDSGNRKTQVYHRAKRHH